MRSVPANLVMLTAFGAALGGCLKPNPAFDPAGAGLDTGATTTGGEPTETLTGTSASPPTGTTGLDGTTGVTTGGVTTGGVVTASTGMSSETGETTGGPADCWGLPLDAFTLEPISPEVLDAGSPSLSPDGLDLYFKAPVAPPTLYEVRRLSRATPGDAFVGPAEVFFGPPDTDQLDYPELVAGATRIYFTQKGGEIYTAKQQNGTWDTWKIAGTTAVFSPQRTESHPNATEDGTRLLFQRDDGAAMGPFRTTFNFYQATLDAQTDEFNTPPILVTPLEPGLALPLCPAMSPDGLHLLFAGKDFPGQLDNVNDGSVGVWYTHRANPDTTWDMSVRSATLREPGWITCPTSITADGCQATLIRFTYPSTLYTMHLARRG